MDWVDSYLYSDCVARINLWHDYQEFSGHATHFNLKIRDYPIWLCSQTNTLLI